MTILSISEEIQQDVYCSHCDTYDGEICNNYDTGMASFDCHCCGLSAEYPL